jgi:outer membrane immunogenic protein
MGRSALSAIILCLTLGAAGAADMPLKARPAPPPALTWQGFYLGAMGGYASGDGIGISSVSFDPRGGFVGGTAGYNWQWGQFVAGLEADAAASGIDATATNPFIVATDKVRSLGSVRGRIGVAFNTVLLYATGGWAWNENRINITSAIASVTDKQFHSGAVGGGGIEWMFLRNWSGKVEYLYRQFDNQNYFVGLFGPALTGLPSGRARYHTMQFGVNYHF